MVDAYFKARQCLGDAAISQRIYYNRDTTPHHFKKGDWVIYWHKLTVMPSGWTGPFIVTEKVSVVDYKIQLNPDGSSKVVHLDQLWVDLYYQDRTGWIRVELAHRADERLTTDPLPPRMATVGVSIVFQTSTTDPIIVASNNSAPKLTVCRSMRIKRRPICLVYYLQI